MAQFSLLINQNIYSVDVEPEMPLLWVLRDVLNLTGTKYSCGIGTCGTCTVLVDGTPKKSCVYPVQSAVGAEITTIEGLPVDGQHPVQLAWKTEKVPQCGYCMPGQILTAAALLQNTPNPTDDQIDEAMRKVLCRCGTYPRIRSAIRSLVEQGGQ
jgi:aerobic-type carbon monoxide dehydrogenase small subunit (CoxS/CutS family)